MLRYSLARLTGQKYQGGNPSIPIGFSTCQRSDPQVGLEQILCADKVEVVLEEFRLQDGLKTELLESDGRYVSRLAMLRDNTGGSVWGAHDWPSGVPVAFVQLEPELRENIFELVFLHFFCSPPSTYSLFRLCVFSIFRGLLELLRRLLERRRSRVDFFEGPTRPVSAG
jgi:hypothetical protein